MNEFFVLMGTYGGAISSSTMAIEHWPVGIFRDEVEVEGARAELQELVDKAWHQANQLENRFHHDSHLRHPDQEQRLRRASDYKEYVALCNTWTEVLKRDQRAFSEYVLRGIYMSYHAHRPWEIHYTWARTEFKGWQEIR